MGSTRHSQLTPIKIFNDSFNDEAQGTHNHILSSPLDNKPVLSPSVNALAPRADTNARLIPPSHAGRSPSKNGLRGTSPPLKSGLSYNSHTLLPTPKSLQGTDSLIKRHSAASFQTITPHLAPKTFNFALSVNSQDKENIFPTAYNSDNFAEFPGPDDGPSVVNSNNKRPLMEASSSYERPAKVHRPIHIPEPHEMPEIVDDGGKPKYSYAQLIAMSILRAPERKLTLADIYKWISRTFKHYRDTPQPGWQNSIRHNLSLHKSFIKQERPRNDPGKGNYWIIDPPKIPDFLEEKAARRPASSHNSSSTSRQASSQSQPAPLYPLQAQPPSTQSTMQPPAPRRPSMSANASAKPIKSASKPLLTVEPSSDATIPLSDPALLEEDGEETFVDIQRPSSRRQSSPQLKSSPPVLFSRSRTDTSASNDMLSSVHGSRKRKNAALNDSGYYSSIESSVMRRPSSRTGLDSLARKRSKTGRAEDEIVRLRYSSQDISPSKTAPFLGMPHNSGQALLSSSPTRHLELDGDALELNSKTSLPRPQIAFSAVSPETQLRNHRNKVSQLISTPMKGLNDVPAGFADMSPMLHLDENAQYDLANLTPGLKFDIFDDQSPLKTRSNASAAKRGSAVRPSLLRAASTPNGALRDVTKSVSNRPTPAGLKPPITFSRLGSPLRFQSPEKGQPTQWEELPADMGSSPLKGLFDEFKNSSKAFAAGFNSPSKDPMKATLSDNAFFFDMKSPGKGLSPIKWSSPGKLLFPDASKSPSKGFDFGGMSGPGNGDIFGFDLFNNDLKTHSPTLETADGLDLAGGFQRIGEEARHDKENMAPPPKRGKPSNQRPALGARSSTSFI